MKRAKAWFLVLIMVFSMSSMFAGCVDTGADSPLSMGQWLTMVADSFGLAGYAEEKPFFKKVDSSNSYFSVFQACAEWDIIEPSDTVDEKTPVTWNDVLISLVNAGEFMDPDATDKEKVAYAIEHFDNSIRSYWGKRTIKMAKAASLLDIAAEKWRNFSYTQTVEKVTVSDEVLNLLEEEDLEYTVEDDTVTIEEDAVADLKPGDVYTLPACGTEGISINRVKSIEIVDGKAVIVNDTSFEQEEALAYVEEMNIEETASVNMDNVTGIYDENGNPIEYEVDPTVDLLAEMGLTDPSVVPLSSGPQVNNLGLNLKGSLNFDVDTDKGTWKVKISMSGDKIAVRIGKQTTMTESSYKESTREIYGQVAFDNLKLTKDVKISWGKLKSAKLRLDYGTSFEGGVVFEKENNVGKEENSPGAPIKQHLSTVLKDYKEAVDGLGKDWRNRGDKDDLYICRLPIPGTGGLVNFIIKGKVTFSGELKLTIDVDGCSGVQYKDGKVRFIKSTTVDSNFVADGKLEITAELGFQITVLKCIDVAEVTGEVGAGLGVTITTHLLDAEGHSVYSGKASLSAEDADKLGTGEYCTDVKSLKEHLASQGINWDAPEDEDLEIKFLPGICFDWKLYPIAKINLGGKDTLVGKLAVKAGVKLTLTILDDDTTLLKGHFDIPGYNPMDALKQDSFGAGIAELFGVGKECSLKKTAWPIVEDKLDETTPTDETTTTEQDDIIYSNRIMISSVRLFLDEGEVAYLEVTELPTGYTLDDLEVIVEDPSIATFDQAYCKVMAHKAGLTQITFRIKGADDIPPLYLAVTVEEKPDLVIENVPEGVVLCGSIGAY